MYRVLIVDDEAEIREGILQKIDWQTLGYAVIGGAENGVEALELAEHRHPDVVMADIKMPFMDGLTLVERLSAQMPSVKFILFSGFDDFEYAQKAIQLGVAEYILKPVNAEELTGSLVKLKKQLDAQLSERRNIETLRRHYEESLPVLREQFLVGLLEGRVPPKQMQMQAERFQLPLEARYWAAAIVHAEAPEEPSGAEETSLKGQEQLIPISVMRTVDEILERFGAFTAFFYSDSVVILAHFEHQRQVTALVNGLNEVCKTAEHVLNVHVAAGVGGLCRDLRGIRHSYREAQTALDYSAVAGVGQVVFIKDVEPSTEIPQPFDEQDERALLNAIRRGEDADIYEQVHTMFSRYDGEHPSFSQYQCYLLEIITALYKLMRSYNISPDQIFGRDFNFFRGQSVFHSAEGMMQWFSEICVKISGCIRRERIDSTKELAQNACRYIQENYADPALSVETLCRYLHVSSAYFSTVFKRETGKTFVSYLTEVRLQRAVYLLNTTEDKTYLIASKVGYTEPNYFSYVFKKRFGISPSKYRASPAAQTHAAGTLHGI